MRKAPFDSQPAPLRGADLELWRIKNGLTKVEAADAFGLQKTKWDQHVTSDKIEDMTVAMLLHLYRQRPEAAPKAPPPNVVDFYKFLGLKDSRRDRELFAVLIGRSLPSAHRLLLQNGTPGRPVVRWIEALKRMHLSAGDTRNVMFNVATTVFDQQGMSVKALKADGQAAEDTE